MIKSDKSELLESEKLFEKYEIRRMRADFTQHLLVIIIAGVGLIAALAWDDALHKVFEEVFGGTTSVLEKVSYALLVTVIAAIMSVIITSILKKGKKLGG